MTEIYTDIDDITASNSEEIEINTKKQPKTAIKEVKPLKFSENQHIADIQQRVIRLEYEFQYLRDKIFEPARTEGQSKLTGYGKLLKKRVQNG